MDAVFGAKARNTLHHCGAGDSAMEKKVQDVV